MQHVVFGQKLKKGFLIALLSFVLVLPVVGSVGFPEPVFATDPPAANTPTTPTTPPATTPAPPATPAAPQSREASAFEKAVDFIAQGPKAVVNLLILTFIQILLKFIELLAYLFSFAIEALKVILTYRGYATQAEVSVAWAIVRDAINSFFIVVLIAIAISTIIRFQVYNFRSTLPRLILAAFLVNFSKTICLLAISFADSVMATFAAQLIAILPSYALGLRLPALASFNPDSIGGLYGAAIASDQAVQADSSQMLSLLISSVLGLVMMAFALAGLVMFMIILLFRIIVLWFLIILSPLAFFLWGVPGRANSYWGQWLEEFIKHIIVGPVGAFFLYIIAYFYIANVQSTYGLSIGADSLPKGGLTLASTPNVLIGYLVSLGMMFIALEIIEKLGVRGGQFAKEWGAKGTLKALRGAYGIAADNVTKYTGIPLNATRAWEGIKGSLSDKREQLAQDAIRKTAKVGASLAERGSPLSFAYAVASGNRDVLAATNISDAFRFAKAAIPGSVEFQNNEKLKGQYKQNKAHLDAVSKYAGLGADKQKLINGMNQSQLADTLSKSAAYKDYTTTKSSIDQLRQNYATARASGDTEATRVANNKLNDALLKTRVYESENADLLASEQAKTELTNIGQNQEDLQKFSDALKESGVQIGANEKINEFGTNTKKTSAIGESQKKVVGELKRRQKFGSLAAAGARSDLTAKMKDYTKDTYEREVKYGTDDIYGNMLLNRDPKKRENFAADLVKAAEMGKFDDVLHKFMDSNGQPYQASQSGVKKFVNEVLRKELGFDDQEALTIIAEAQGRNMAAKKSSQIYVKMDAATKDYSMFDDEAAQAKVVESKIKEMSSYEALRTLKLDGLGHKDGSGKFTANQGAIRAIKAGGLKKLIENDNQFNQIDAETKREFLIRYQKDLGLDAGDVAKIEASLK